LYLPCRSAICCLRIFSLSSEDSLSFCMLSSWLAEDISRSIRTIR
jgi:hypothetical protein